MKTYSLLAVVVMLCLAAVGSVSHRTNSTSSKPARIKQRIYGTCLEVRADGRLIVDLTLGGTIIVKPAEPYDFDTVEELREAVMVGDKLIEFFTMVPADGNLTLLQGEIVGEMIYSNGKSITQRSDQFTE